ncbi:hypothetical protein D3C87_2036920 [compost metagenome]
MTRASGRPISARTCACSAMGSSTLSAVWKAMSTSAEAVNSTVAKPALKLRAASTLSSNACGMASPVSKCTA